MLIGRGALSVKTIQIRAQHAAADLPTSARSIVLLLQADH